MRRRAASARGGADRVRPPADDGPAGPRVSRSDRVAARFPGRRALDPRGIAAADAAEAAAWAPREGDRAWCGTSRRCAETAAAFGITAVPTAALDDCDFGRWRGRSLTDVQAAEPAAVRRWLTDPAAAPRRWIGRGPDQPGRLLAGGPTPRAGTRCRDHARRRDPGRRPARPRCPPASFWRIDVAPLSRTVLRGRRDRWTVRSRRLHL